MGAARKGFGDTGVRGWWGWSHGTELAERGVPGLRRGEGRGYERGAGALRQQITSGVALTEEKRGNARRENAAGRDRRRGNTSECEVAFLSALPGSVSSISRRLSRLA